jgi:hypothetical protein
MVWVQAFPTNNTLISQSVGQIQANWLFLQQNIGTDHYFDTGNANEGHHQFSQYVNQAGDPALAVDGVVYVKPNASSGAIQPYFRNAGSIRQLPVFYSVINAMGAPGANFALFNLAGFQVPFYGFFIVAQVGGAANQASGIIAWDGTTNITQLSASGNPVGPVGLYAVGSDGGTHITISQNVAGITNWQLVLLQMLP